MSDGKTREGFPENPLQDGILRQRMAQKTNQAKSGPSILTLPVLPCISSSAGDRT